jgi:hypothetical protein
MDNLTIWLIGVVLFVVLIIYDIFLLTIFIPGFIAMMIVFSVTSKEKNEYYKAKQVLTLSLAFTLVVIMSFYYLFQNFFETPLKDASYILFLSAFFMLSVAFLWLNKRVVPVSFLEDDDRIVQETMYEDGDYTQNLQRAFAYRGTLFKDGVGKKIKPTEIHKAKGTLIPLDLDLWDVETEAVDKNGELKSQAAIFNLFQDLVLNEGKNQKQLEKYYGYCYTIELTVRNEKEFAEALKNTSIFYYKIYEFLKKDCDHPQVQVDFVFQAMYLDSLRCLEITLMLMIHMTRQYMNFPVGDLSKYVRTTKDKQFLGAFASLPSDFYSPGTTSVAPAGVAYYYAYYAIHGEGFEDIEGTMKRYVKEKIKKEA